MTTIVLLASGLILLSLGILIGTILGVVAAAASVPPEAGSSQWSCPKPGCDYRDAHYHMHDDGVVFAHEVPT